MKKFIMTFQRILVFKSNSTAQTSHCFYTDLEQPCLEGIWRPAEDIQNRGVEFATALLTIQCFKKMPQIKANADQFYFSRGEIEDEFEKLFERTNLCKQCRKCIKLFH